MEQQGMEWIVGLLSCPILFGVYQDTVINVKLDNLNIYKSKC